MSKGFVNTGGFAQCVQEECGHALTDARRLFCFLKLSSHTAEVELGRVNCPGPSSRSNRKELKF